MSNEPVISDAKPPVASADATNVSQAAQPVGGIVTARPTFDVERHTPRVGRLAQLAASVFGSHWFWWLVRVLWPIPRARGWALVSRYDDVVEVLSDDNDFRVPFGDEIQRLNDGKPDGTPFILGIDDPKQEDQQQHDQEVDKPKEKEHERQLRLVMRAFRHADLKDVEKISWDAARGQLASRVVNSQIDAIEHLIMAVPLRICERYYGIEIEEPRTFAYASMAVSGHLFGKPPIENDSEAANDGAAYIRAVVDNAVSSAVKSATANPGDGSTVVRRLAAQHLEVGSTLSRLEVRAILMGMIIGFVPTNTLAGGHILETLCRRKDFMRRAREAASTGDDTLLMRHLFEALRFKPINPGPFRMCAEDHYVGGDSRRAACIRKGTNVLVSTQSAMFDRLRIEQPRKFNADRDASDYLHFGYGLHWCVGVHIARVQITQTFKALLRHGKFAADGSMSRRGVFPEHYSLRFRKPAQ